MTLRNKRVLLTAGPTREPMDPVRYLTNSSSGQMGISLARELKAVQAQPTVVLGPVPGKPPRGIRVKPVMTAREMYRAVFDEVKSSDVFISTAAVCDYRFARVSPNKIKKGSQFRRRIDLILNPDILKAVGAWKRKQRRSRPILIGFALETNQLRSAMMKKMREKNLDLIIGNSPRTLGRSTIQPVWLEKGGGFHTFRMMSKKQLSRRIVQWIKAKFLNF